MELRYREVTRMPLEQLWDEGGSFGRRVGYLTRDDIRSVLAQGPVRFVEADVGAPLRWTALGDCFPCWKEVTANIARPSGFRLEDFPGEFAFVASEWEGRSGERLIVLEMQH